jgi:hypothetical protein
MFIRGEYAGESGAGMNARSQEQAELPAWLETLRASEGGQPAPVPRGPVTFPVSGMSNDDLPSWLRAGQLDAGESAGATPLSSVPSQRSATAPAPNTDAGFIMGGMSASSLIDEQSLPSWMREAQGTTTSSREPISASSLVQPEVLPEWMRAAQAPASLSPAETQQQQQPEKPFLMGAGPIAGNDLVDPQALPQWMTNDQHGTPIRGEHGFSASSLIDEHALPAWMRESGQAAQQAPIQTSFSNAPTAFGQAPFFNGQPAYQQPPATPPAPSIAAQGERMQGGLSAASFIDMNALPDWLRSPDEQRQGGHPLQPQGYSANAPYQVQAPFAGPGRPDALRPSVPGRPRSGMGTQEESEVAANVFASMLGVASATPNFSGQPQQAGDGNETRSAQPMGGMPQSLAPGVGGAGTAMPAPGINTGAGQNSMYGVMPQWQTNGTNSAASYADPSMGEYGRYGQGMQQSSSSPDVMMGMKQEQAKSQAKAGKRSIFEAIRDWLFHN